MPVLRPRMDPRRTIPERELEVGVCDVKIVGYARTVISRSSWSLELHCPTSCLPKDALPGGPICTNPGIEIAKDYEHVLSGYAVNCSSESRIELVLILIRVLHCWDINTYECGAVILGEGESD